MMKSSPSCLPFPSGEGDSGGAKVVSIEGQPADSHVGPSPVKIQPSSTLALPDTEGKGVNPYLLVSSYSAKTSFTSLMASLAFATRSFSALIPMILSLILS